MSATPTGIRETVESSGIQWETHGGEMAQAAVDWLDWGLMSDTTAAECFLGEDCGLCGDLDWTVKKRNHP